MAAARQHLAIGTCQQCGVTAVLSLDEWCASCLAQAGRVGQGACQQCGAIGKQLINGVCEACYSWMRRVVQFGQKCRQCAQVVKLNNKGLCTACAEQRRQAKPVKVVYQGWSRYSAACVECGTTERPHEGKGLCKLCYYRRWKHHRGKVGTQA